MNAPLILGIESSCDETGVALVDWQTLRLVGERLHSQVSLHRDYGGVVPELASRDHIRRLAPLIAETMTASACTATDIAAVAYTQGPGLAGALMVGAAFAEAWAAARTLPVLPIHHLEGHLLSPLLDANPPSFPFVALLASGGHTALLDVAAFGDYRLLGETLDDAVGEAFDKTAKRLGLPYPGGAALAELAEQGHHSDIVLPRPLWQSNSLDFSFSGLKTAVCQQCDRRAARLSAIEWQACRADMAFAFQEVVVALLVKKSLAALAHTGRKRLVVAGGVSANRRLRSALVAAASEQRFAVHFPPPALCTDNGAMIALAGAMHWRRQATPQNDRRGGFTVRPRWPLTTAAANEEQRP